MLNLKIGIVSVIYFFIIVLNLFSEETTLHIYKYENELNGGGMTEYIDVNFYDGGIIKSVFSYWPVFIDKVGPDIYEWKRDSYDRSEMKIIWQIPQYRVYKDENIIRLEYLRFNEDQTIDKNNSDLNYRRYEYDNLNNKIYIQDAVMNIRNDYSFEIQKNEKKIMQYSIDDNSNVFRYDYENSNNYYEYLLNKGIYYQYNYFVVNNEISKWEYNIQYNPIDNNYTIFKKDPNDLNNPYESKYIIPVLSQNHYTGVFI